ncbi:hypothetical protein [Bacillus nitroreducens]
MIELLLLFVLLLLTALARYLVYDAFEPLMFSLIFILPILSLVIYYISKKLADKERSFQPKNIQEWSFYNIQKSLMIKKPLFRGDVKRGYVKRYFPKKWQYAFGDIFGFNWYLCLEIKIDQDLYDVKWYRAKRFAQQDQWKIYKNGQQIGDACTLINLKNSVKLKEAIQCTFTNHTYVTSATTVTSGITLTKDEERVGTLKRNHLMSSIQVIDVPEDERESLIALLIHSLFFKNK